MEFLKHLRLVDEGLKTAEKQLLNEDTNGLRQILGVVTNGPFSDDAQRKLEAVRNPPYYGGSTLYYQNNVSEGYAPTQELRKSWPGNALLVSKVMYCIRRFEDGHLVKRLWYWEMTQTIDFADRLEEKFGILPLSPFRDEFFDLSALRDLSYELWTRVVRNSIHRRVKTPLEQIARFFQMKLPWVEIIARIGMPRDDKITDDLIYICKNPDFTSELLVDVPIAEDGQVIYLVVCPSCGRNNKQGTLSCTFCGAKI